MPGLSDVIAAGGGTYRGPVENIYEQHIPGPTEIFLILEFKIAGVARTLQLAPGDVTVLDGNGRPHGTLAAQFLDNGKWYPFDLMTISPESAKAKQIIVSGFDAYEVGAKYRWQYERWIFVLPADSLDGATISFQGMRNPVTLSK